ncbi:hypothetical protein TNCV_4079531 [Trichonephila clavipes]|nr:hypothetical protein TNCV_4079531 [Trichonephila clavipes]
MACERKLIESEATTGFFVLLGTKGKKVGDIRMVYEKTNLIASRYECLRFKNIWKPFKSRSTFRFAPLGKVLITLYVGLCVLSSPERMALPQPVENASQESKIIARRRCRSVRKPFEGTWFSESKLAIIITLRLTRYWFGKSMNAFVT